MKKKNNKRIEEMSAKELKQAGANNICYFTLAKTSKKQNL